MSIQKFFLKTDHFFLGETQNFSFEHRLLNGAILFSTLIFLFSTFVNIIIGLNSSLTLETFIASVGLFALYLYCRVYKHFKTSLILLFLIINTILSFIWFNDAGSKGSTLNGFLISIILFLFLTNKFITKLLILIFNFLLISILFFVEYKNPEIITQYPTDTIRLLDVYITFMLIAILLIIIGYLNKIGFKTQHREKEKYFQQLLIEVNERKKIEAQLFKEKNLFNNIFELNPLSIALFDNNGFYLKGNKSGKELFIKEPPPTYCFFTDENLLKLGFEEKFDLLREGKTVDFPEIWYNPSKLNTAFPNCNVCVKTMMFPLMNDQNEIDLFVQIHQNITESKIAMEALKESEKRFRDLANLLPETVYETDENGMLTFINKIGLDSFGYHQSDFEKGFHSILVIAPSDREKAIKMREVTKGLKETTHYEYLAMRKDGSTFPVIIYTSPIFKNDIFIGTRGLIINITDRKKAEAYTIAALEEKKVLLREIYHRVKNNLQHVSGLLGLQANLLKDKNSIDIFTECQNRVRAMSLVHERLYKTENLAKICFKNYLEDLIENLCEVYQTKNSNIKFDLFIDNIFFNIDYCIPLGLITSEIISNSFKYAFDKHIIGKIRIELRNNNNEIELQISDNGCGLPTNFNINSTQTLGLQLVSSLANQINAKLDIYSKQGTQIKLTFILTDN